MKMTFFVDSGGFRISQQWYGARFKRKTDEQAATIVQKIVRTQRERWGGGKRFLERDSHTAKHVQRKFKEVEKKKGKKMNMTVKMGDVPDHLKSGFSKSKAPAFVPFPVSFVYCGETFREGERERLALEKRLRLRKEIYDKKKEERRLRRGGARSGLEEGEKYSFENFFSAAAKSSEDMEAAKIKEEMGEHEEEGEGADDSNVLVIGQDFFNHLETFGKKTKEELATEAEEREREYLKKQEFEKEKEKLRKMEEVDTGGKMEPTRNVQRNTVSALKKSGTIIERKKKNPVTASIGGGGEGNRKTIQFKGEQEEAKKEEENKFAKAQGAELWGGGETKEVEKEESEDDEDLDFLAGQLADDAFSKLDWE